MKARISWRKRRVGIAFQGMRTGCPFCKADSALMIRRHRPASIAFTTVMCRGCGLMRAEPLPGFEEWREWMSAQDEVDTGGAERRQPRQVQRDGNAALERVRRLHPFLTAGAQMLYAGPGGREFAYLMDRAGGRVSLITLEECLAAVLRPGISLEAEGKASVSEALPAGPFDCIAVVDGLPRAPDPVALLAGLAAILKRNGTLAIEAPDLESPAPGWADSSSREDLFRFNAVTLERCAHLAGLRPLVLTPLMGQTVLWGVFARAGRGTKDRSLIPENVERLLALERGFALAGKPGWPAAVAGRMARWWRGAAERFAVRGPRNPEAILEALARQAPALEAAEAHSRSASSGSG